MSTASELTVCHDSGWVDDDHHICWRDDGAFLGHPEGCPFYEEKNPRTGSRLRVYCCSPGHFARTEGVSLDDLPPDEAAACREFKHGSEPIRWRLSEYIHPDLTVEQQDNMSIFTIQLAHMDEEHA